MSSYRIQSGDTLSAIAARFGVSVKAVTDANNISDPDKIVAGKELVIPVPWNEEAGDTYTIQKGDTIFDLARKNGLTTSVLQNQFYSSVLALNQDLAAKTQQLDSLMPGTKIILPKNKIAAAPLSNNPAATPPESTAQKAEPQTPVPTAPKVGAAVAATQSDWINAGVSETFDYLFSGKAEFLGKKSVLEWLKHPKLLEQLASHIGRAKTNILLAMTTSGIADKTALIDLGKNLDKIEQDFQLGNNPIDNADKLHQVLSMIQAKAGDANFFYDEHQHNVALTIKNMAQDTKPWGNCGPLSIILGYLLEKRGANVSYVTGTFNGVGHAWLELSFPAHQILLDATRCEIVESSDSRYPRFAADLKSPYPLSPLQTRLTLGLAGTNQSIGQAIASQDLAGLQKLTDLAQQALALKPDQAVFFKYTTRSNVLTYHKLRLEWLKNKEPVHENLMRETADQVLANLCRSVRRIQVAKISAPLTETIGLLVTAAVDLNVPYLLERTFVALAGMGLQNEIIAALNGNNLLLPAPAIPPVAASAIIPLLSQKRINWTSHELQSYITYFQNRPTFEKKSAVLAALQKADQRASSQREAALELTLK